MRIAICDDDADFAGKLKRLVERELMKRHTEPDILIYHDGGVLLAEHPTCDAVFLDIDLKQFYDKNLEKSPKICYDRKVIKKQPRI